MNSNDAKAWISYAETDLRTAYALLDNGEFFLRQVCFFGQQCAEKAIQSILVFEDLGFPRSCNLDRLRELLPQSWKLKKQFPNLSGLTAWSMKSCYPGYTPDVTEYEARQTLQLAQSVLDTVSSELQERMQGNRE